MAYGTINADLHLDSSGGRLAPISSVMRNRIINGAMVIAQYGTGSTTPTASGYFSCDRWYAQLSVASKYSIQQNAGSVTPPAGYTNYLGITSTSAYSISSSDQFNINQRIEGFNIADLGWGTANAKTVTLSFQVYSSLTGTFGGAITNSAVDRSYPFSYIISAANTWTTISITVAGDTTGTWVTNNGIGIRLYINLGAGSTLSGTAGAWAGATYTSCTGATSVVGTSGATFYITGVQLEVGSSATGFEYRQYGTELALCQRYYEIGDLPSFVVVSNVTGVFPNKAFSTTKRASSTVTISPSGGTGAAVTSGIAGFYQSTNHSGNSQASWTASAEL
jgi:hypothetical protein